MASRGGVKIYPFVLANIKHFLAKLVQIPDVQCAWLLLLYCAASRCNHTLRTLPPDLSQDYAERHDIAMRRTLSEILGRSDINQTNEILCALCTMKHSHGGLGLRSARRTAPAAYWASIADTIPEIQKRYPRFGQRIVQWLNSSDSIPHSMTEAAEARRHLINSGYHRCPGWQDIAAGIRPPPIHDVEPGEWAHGWQFHAATHIEYHYRNRILYSMSPSQRAMVRSQSGRGSGAHLSITPTCPELCIENEHMNVILLRRLRLPLPLTSRFCNGRRCRRELDSLGDHRAACPKSGRLKRRSIPMENMIARICREGGARVRTNVLVRDLNIGNVDIEDGRRIEVIAEGLPLYNGRQIAIDATLISTLTREGRPHHHSDDTDGAALNEARRKKERHYSDIVTSQRCHLLVAGIETGGRWEIEFSNFVQHLARNKSRNSIPILARSMQAILYRRWQGLVAVASHKAFAKSLLDEDFGDCPCEGGSLPQWSELV